MASTSSSKAASRYAGGMLRPGGEIVWRRTEPASCVREYGFVMRTLLPLLAGESSTTPLSTQGDLCLLGSDLATWACAWAKSASV